MLHHGVSGNSRHYQKGDYEAMTNYNETKVHDTDCPTYSLRLMYEKRCC